MSLLYPILFVDLLKQSSYKNAILLSMLQKQFTYFSKKYSKSNKITLNKANRLPIICDEDNIKAIRYIHFKKTAGPLRNNNFILKNAISENIKIIHHLWWYGMVNNEDVIYIKTLSQWNKQNKKEFAIDLFIKKGKKLYPNKDYLFLHCVQNNYTHSVKTLLDKGANIHFGDDYALCWSAENGCAKMVKLLIDKGANIHAHRNYPIIWSMCYGYNKTVKLLLKHGANKDEFDNDAFIWCMNGAHIKTAKLILKVGPDLDLYRALKKSIYFGHIKIIKILFSMKNIEIKHKYKIKWKENSQEVINLLFSHGIREITVVK